ncbi:acyl-[ACP]--phospholipid O-acyltransferase [Marinomonas spartinae]|uniref:acyl-[ACP]--phospholipid O-acyltransferase n=1 Tax=Marinomonas spartinae TaxID=1792290 RepID=UPI0018F1F8DA|nr:acyl-[ACP]--phospholipid O-acyltransferase [Marinomonas spartinae]MBJ7555189.1 acyl-[ACP]--phospholipid O-acyltransferase [Marinomonas spartinae]
MNSLYKVRGFAAFISVAFLNSFVDLGHKIIIQNTLFKSYDGSYQVLLTALVNALVLLPYILLVTPAGFLSDRYKKKRVMQMSAAIAIVITLMITWCYYHGRFIEAFAFTFILGLQSAIYSPAKYGYIREMAGVNRLSEGNGWIQGVTMIAILSGIVVFSALFELLLPTQSMYSPDSVFSAIAPLGWLLVIGSCFEFYLTLRLPEGNAVTSSEAFNWSNYARGRTLKQNISLLGRHKAIWQSILGLTLFWSISQVLLAVFPAYSKEHLGMTNAFVIQATIAVSGIGVLLGSMWANSMSRNQINLSLIPVGIAGVTLGAFIIPMAHSFLILACAFFIIGLFGAMFSVPLNALIQFHARNDQLGRTLAGSNYIQNIGMLAFLGLTIIFALTDLDVSYLLWGLGFIVLAGTLAAIHILPEALLRGVMAIILARKYRLNVLGLEHLKQSGQGVLLLGNHISWLDWAMVQMACPRHVHFVMDRGIYQRWYLKWFFDRYKVIPISGGQSRQALEQVTELLNQGEVVCLFPEGAISHLGQLGEFKHGFERACADSKGVIVPFYLRGMWGSVFSRSSQKLSQLRKSGLKRDVTIAFGTPMDIHSTAETVKQKVFEMSVTSWNDYTDTLEPLAHSWIRTAKAKPTDWAIVDSKGEPLGHQKLLTMTALLQRRIKKLPGKNLGLLVPTSSPGVAANMAALMAGKTIVNINYTSTPEAQLHAVKQADIQGFVTAHRFIQQLEKRGIDCQALLAGKDVIYLEDFHKGLNKVEAVSTAVMAALLPTSWLQWLWCSHCELDDAAAILFSSGSEGTPKGVVLSHRNIMANIRQVSDVLNVRDNDRIMATLPLFHAFGLTVTGLLPLLEGVPAICHPDPTDGLNIAKAVTKHEATLMCATSTFLRLYTRNRRIHPLMFSSLRAVVSGAEKLDPQVRDAFTQRFGKTILEGYGTTETTPVASVNLPGYINRDTAQVQEAARTGTVGMALPGTTFRIVDPNSLETLPVGEDGLILIGGAQIMKGYLEDPEKTADVIVEMDGLRWYKTGDKGHLDEDGYLTVVDRYSRFAKLGGEMVSLGAVEQQIRTILQSTDLSMVAVNVPDEKKGERVILLVGDDANSEDIRQSLVEAKMPALMMPSEIIQVDALPILGSGKLDFKAAKQLALDNTQG